MTERSDTVKAAALLREYWDMGRLRIKRVKLTRNGRIKRTDEARKRRMVFAEYRAQNRMSVKGVRFARSAWERRGAAAGDADWEGLGLLTDSQHGDITDPIACVDEPGQLEHGDDGRMEQRTDGALIF